MAEDELEDIRRRRLQELQRRQETAGHQEAMQAEAERRAAEQAEAQKDAILRAALTPDARERLGRLRLARPEEARALEYQIVQLAQSQRLQGQIDDEQLKIILGRLFPSGRDIKIQRK